MGAQEPGTTAPVTWDGEVWQGLLEPGTCVPVTWDGEDCPAALTATEGEIDGLAVRVRLLLMVDTVGRVEDKVWR